MNPGTRLLFGLKEWSTVCRTLESGRQILLLRKGGVYESAGEFELEHSRFLLFPTFVHQNLNMLKPEAHAGFESRSVEPDRVELRAFADATDIVPLASRRQMAAIDDEHIWTEPLIDMRFDYRPENPLYLLLVRVYALPRPVEIANTPAYAGCKSWLPLNEPVDIAGARAVLPDDAFAARRSSILARIGETHVTA